MCSNHFSRYPETFQAIRKLSRLSGNFPDHPENIQPVQELSRLSRNFPGYPEIFRIIRKISSLSRNFPGYLDIFQRVRKLPSAILRVMRKNFPKAQKLSGWQRHPATQVFGLWPGPQHLWTLIILSWRFAF